MTDFEEGADTLMTTAEVAALLRVKERKIYELVSENQIPHTKVTGKLLFPKARPLPLSAAIVPLEKERNLGMLALAARDADRFQPKQGKYFLEMTADLVAAALRARLG